MDLRQLRYFSAVAEERHVGRASERLHVAQPALSRQIQKLEQEFGKKLFIRHAKGVTLTGDGAQLLDTVRRILKDVDELALQFTGNRKAPSGEVTVASTPAMAGIISLPIMKRVAELYPDIRLRIRGAFMPSMEEVLLRGDADLAIFNGLPQRSDFVVQHLFREQLCVVCLPTDDRFGARPQIQVNELINIPFVLSGLPKTGVRRVIDGAVARVGFSLDVVGEADTVAASNKLVLAGLGPTIHVASLIQKEIGEGQFRAIPIEGLYLSRVLASSGKLPLSPAVNAVAQIIAHWAEDLLLNEEWPGVEPIVMNEAASN